MSEQNLVTEQNPEPAAGDAPAPVEPATGEGINQEATTTTPAQEEPSSGESDTGNQEEPSGLLRAEDESKPQDGDAGVLGAPEGSYEINAPEGSALDSTVMGEFEAVAKELNLSQDAVQKIVDRMAPTWQKQGLAQVEHFRKEWIDQSKADKEFGGNNFEANLKGINRAYAQFTTPELRALLAGSALDSHPEMLRLFHRLDKATREGRFIRGSAAGALPADDIRNFYKGLK